MKIGSHVGMSAPTYLVSAVNETLSYGANAFMIYTGAPQNTKRKDTSEMHIEEAHQLMKENNIPLENMIIHAPYIINLANTVKEATFELAVEFLQKEIERTKALGAKTIVLHPGSHVNEGMDVGLQQIVKGLDEAMKDMGDVKIALETMAGKGSEVGFQFDQIKYIIDHAKYSDSLGVCMDTCHIHDAGYDLKDFDTVLQQFDDIIGLDRLLVMHINDSKNVNGARKDRHENIGYGEIGFDSLNYIVHHEKLKDIVKILETPYIEKNPPYYREIKMLKEKTFNTQLKEEVISNPFDK